MLARTARDDGACKHAPTKICRAFGPWQVAGRPARNRPDLSETVGAPGVIPWLNLLPEMGNEHSNGGNLG